jgi:hypothetical protein
VVLTRSRYFFYKKKRRSARAQDAGGFLLEIVSEKKVTGRGQKKLANLN